MISYYTYLPSKAIMVKSFKTMQYIQCLPFDVYLHSALVRLLLANAISIRMVLSGAVSLGHVIPFLVCNSAVPSQIPVILVSRYKGFASL